MNETELRAMLQQGLCSIIYVKLDGSRRHAVATTCLTFVPQNKWPKDPTKRKVQPWVKDDYVRYYDLTVQDWRCLVCSEIIECKPLDTNPNS